MDDTHPRLILFHFIAELYGWDWEAFYYKCPVPVLKQIPKMITKRYSEKGSYVGHMEMMMTRALLRVKGADI